MNQTLGLWNYSTYRLALDINKYSLPIYTSMGIIGNLLSFIVLVSSSLTRSTTCMYMMVIAVLDSTILLVHSLTQATQLHLVNDSACRVKSFIFYFSVHFVTLLIVVMTAERYVVVRYPLKASAWITHNKTKRIITLVGVFSFFLNLHNAFIREVKYDSDRGVKMCLYSDRDSDMFFMTKVYPWIDSVVYCFFPLLSLSVLNFLIIKGLHDARHGMDKYDNNGSSKRKQQRQVTIMLILVSVVFLTLTTPLGVILVVQKYAWFPSTLEERAFYILVRSFTDNLMYTNHAVNFFLYVLSGQKFRQEFRRLVCGSCCRHCERKKRVVVRQRQIYMIREKSPGSSVTT